MRKYDGMRFEDAKEKAIKCGDAVPHGMDDKFAKDVFEYDGGITVYYMGRVYNLSSNEYGFAVYWCVEELGNGKCRD